MCAYQSLSHVQIFVTPWTVDGQAPLSIEFPRQEYWSGLPFCSPGDLPNPGIEPQSPTLQADSLPSEPPGKSFLPLTFEQLEIHQNGISFFLHSRLRLKGPRGGRIIAVLNKES